MSLRIFAVLLFLGFAPAAFSQQLINCNPSTACSSSTGPAATGGGDPLWLAFGKVNANETQLFNGVFPVSTKSANGDFYATSYGVKANGTTDDSVALAAAAAACNAVGGRLWLPAGNILLAGAAQVTLNHCAMYGTGAAGSDAAGFPYGTTFSLTNTTVSPFILRTSFVIQGINFVWPNNLTSGVTVYPPALTDDGIAGHGMSHGLIDHIAVINAWDFLTTTVGTGEVKVTNSTMWGYHYLFTLNNVGDSWLFANNRYVWDYNVCSSAPCQAALSQAFSNGSAVFHIASGPGVTFVVNGGESFFWRNFILIDSGASLGGGSLIQGMAWDGLGSIIDSSSGGTYAANNLMVGNTNSFCAIWSFSGGNITHAGNPSCFNLGSNSSLTLTDFFGQAQQGSFIVGAGGNTIRLNNVIVIGIGAVNDGADYYVVNLPTSGFLNVKNSNFQGLSSNAHVHAFNVGTSTIGSPIVITNTNFIYFNDILQGTSNNPAIITSNTSLNTNAGGGTIELAGNGSGSCANNSWDVAASGAVCSSSNANVYELVQSSIPMIIEGAGSIANNCAITALNTLPATYSNGAYIYLPTGAIAAASAAGFYYFVGSSTTAGTCYNNTYTAGTPIIPASPTAFVTTGPGNFTVASGARNALSITVPGATIGVNGGFDADVYAAYSNSANGKTLTLNYGAVNLFSSTPTTTTQFTANAHLRNAGLAAVQTTYSMNATSSGTSAAPSVARGTVNSAASQTMSLSGSLAATTDFIVFETYGVLVRP